MYRICFLIANNGINKKKYTADFTKIKRSEIFKERESRRDETSYKEVVRQKSCNAI
jgi:hypothetical protein